jgi:hypothetical protein
MRRLPNESDNDDDVIVDDGDFAVANAVID